MRQRLVRAVGLACVAWAWGCGGRSDLDFGRGLVAVAGARDDGGHGVDATVDAHHLDGGRDASVDRTSVDRLPPPEDTGHDAGYDARHHRHDGGFERFDAGHDSGGHEGHDAGGDAGVDTGVTCPAAYPGTAFTRCSVPGAVCTYPEGACTCYGECGCGAPPGCADFDVTCGPFYSPCAQELDCGECPPGQACGANGDTGTCSPAIDAGADCVPLTCAEVPDQCGVVLDGCGHEIDCGWCFQWGCSPAIPECPLVQPPTGAPCGVEGASCPYDEWTEGCCEDTLACVAGFWRVTGVQCPD